MGTGFPRAGMAPAWLVWLERGIVAKMDTTDTNDTRRQLALAKLTAFQRIEAEFLRSFRFMEILQGQQRLPICTVADSVRFLHALWICECKDKLLSISQTMGRYEGRRCLELMRSWQVGDTAAAVDFLQRKLNNLSTAELTNQIHEARVSGNEALANRLGHGRGVMVNRGFHLMQILDAIFALPEHLLLEHSSLRPIRARAGADRAAIGGDGFSALRVCSSSYAGATQHALDE